MDELIVGGEKGLYVLDVSDPKSPKVTKHVDLDGEVRSILSNRRTGTVYVIIGGDDPRVAIFSDVRNSEILHEIRMDDITPWSMDVRGEDERLYIFGDGKFAIVNIDKQLVEEPEIMSVFEDESLEFFSSIAMSIGVDGDGDYVYLGGEVSQILILDVSDAYDPWIISDVETEEETWALHVDKDGKYLYAGAPGIVHVINVSDPNYPEVSVVIDDFGGDLHLLNDKLYVAGSSNFGIVDMTDPEYPKVLSSLDVEEALDDYADNVYVKENFAYVLLSSGKLAVIDVSDPKNPQVVNKGVEIPGDGINVIVKEK